MSLLLLAVSVVLIVSAFCSLSEAAFYSVRMPYVRSLAESGQRSGLILDRFKRNMERPITAILIINTLANTAGAALAGSEARAVFGESADRWFPLLLALAVLLFAEILPKVAGVTYDSTISRSVALPWSFAMVALSPVVWTAQKLTRIVQRREPDPLAPEEEVQQVAALSAEEGSILPIEAELVKNVLRLDEIRAQDIMTPRTVVFKLPESATVRDVADQVARCPYSRIPIHGEDPEDWVGLVMKSEILGRMARDEYEVPLHALRRPLEFVPTMVPGHKLLSEFLRRRRHLLAVIDEYGGIAGVVSLEDVMETLIGEEIVDETDRDVDLQEVARRRAHRFEKLDPSGSPPSQE
ncbi:MAG: hemolysin family protein [Holophagales bacterium]|nr:hemolysin family protein [Holophagales bacterium]